MMERMFIAADRRVWFVRPRHDVRRAEVDTHVTLEMMSDRESRVVSCRREEWEVPAPDFAGLLARVRSQRRLAQCHARRRHPGVQPRLTRSSLSSRSRPSRNRRSGSCRVSSSARR